MSRQIRIQIRPDGTIHAQVQGIKGAGCTEYISVIEQLLNAETIDSEYTNEYYEREENKIEAQDHSRLQTDLHSREG